MLPPHKDVWPLITNLSATALIDSRLQPLLQGNFWFPVQDPAGQGDIRLALHRVVGEQGGKGQF